MLSQSEVNSIVAREKQAAAARARQEAEREYQQRAEQMQSRAPAQQEQQRYPTDADADAIYQQVQERFNQEMQERQFQQEMTTAANAYHAKMDYSRKNYSDFDEITKDFDPTAFPQLVYLVSGVENGGDIIYELSKNPQKLVTLDSLAKTSPRLAQAELVRLSQSITNNNMARQEAEMGSTNAPLSPLQPSRVSGSEGPNSIRDLRAQPWLRG
jgi:hypothetical protein